MADWKPTVNDGDTRKRIPQLLLKYNPAPAIFIADTLGLPAVGVRCHIDILVNEGLTETTPASSASSRGRGRSAKSRRLTDRGHARFGHAYDDLVSATLTVLRKTGDEQAVARFTRQRTNGTLLGVTPVGQDTEKKEVVETVVDAFRRAGYAVTINQNIGDVQICQHHCPISHVASELPELCAAGHKAISKLLGQHTQPLAIIADGNGICTTSIPLTPVAEAFTESPQERSGE